MTREFSAYTDAKVKSHLQDLLDSCESPERYRQAMKELGRDLAKAIGTHLRPGSNLDLVCAVEDADFLAKALFDEVCDLVKPSHITFTCYWNERTENRRTAPIIRRYSEVPPEKVHVLIIVKSIISGACVVRTNLSERLATVAPERIFVVAPVIRKGAEDRLAKEFSPDVAERFEFFYFARDPDKDDAGNVLPGIGGNVYRLLGFGDQKTKNRYHPSFVESRLKQNEFAP